MPTCDGQFGPDEPGIGPLRWFIVIVITLLPLIALVVGSLLHRT